jgi:putative transposase
VDEIEEDTQVAKNGHSEEQILRALREAEGGSRVADICREHGVSEATFYIWKKKYSGLGLSELRELRQLREENSKLKHLVADLSLDRQILQEIVQKSYEASSSARARALDADRLRTEHAAGVGADDDQLCRRPAARRALVPGGHGCRSVHARMPVAPGRQLAHRPERWPWHCRR